MTMTLVGPQTWKGRRLEDGHREYKITWKVESSDTSLGPAAAMQCPGLPQPGDYWTMDSDVDLWAWCRPEMDVSPFAQVEGSPVQYWLVEQTFSTKPLKKCADVQIEDPLMEPQEVSGDLVKFSEERTHDRNGNPIVNSAFEQIRGSQVEFDANRDKIRIKQNVALLELELLVAMRDTVNDSLLWGCLPRFIKFSNYSWTRKFHGMCQVYYERVLEFEVYAKRSTTSTPGALSTYVSGWDRDILDEGQKVLRGHWRIATGTAPGGWIPDADANASNPSHFIRYKDVNGENTRVILNGHGVPYDPVGATTGTGDDRPGNIHVEGYHESNFLLLGIPTSF